jgi:hypothetical protein
VGSGLTRTVPTAAVGAFFILDRLADDRIQEERRYLCRLRWHLFMSYQEVSYDQLQHYVSESKMAILDDLFSSIADSDYDGIDRWVAQCEKALPIVVDKWRVQNPGWNEDEDLIK